LRSITKPQWVLTIELAPSNQHGPPIVWLGDPERLEQIPSVIRLNEAETALKGLPNLIAPGRRRHWMDWRVAKDDAPKLGSRRATPRVNWTSSFRPWELERSNN
jgi:hypothetical protein